MKIRVADLIADYLYKQDYRDVFMLTGGGAMHLNDGLGNSKLNCHYLLHEQACAIAAEGYARTNGKPACVCVTTGPGGSNAITGVLGAFLDSIPMLVISGQVKYITTKEYSNLPIRQLGDQEFDIITSVKNMTKYAVMVNKANEVLYHIEKAVYLANTGRKAPCWVDIPLDIQSAIVDTDDLKKFDSSELEGIKPVGADTVCEIFNLLKGAKRPIIYVGAGIRKSENQDLFFALSEKLQIPLVCSWVGIDLVQTDNPLYAGRAGMMGDRAGNFAVQTADVVLVLASRLNIRQVSYNYENFAKNAKVIMVDIDRNELDKHTLNLYRKVQADVGDFMRKMLAIAEKINCKKWLEYCQDNVKKYPVVLDSYYDNNDENKINPYIAFEKLSKMMSEDSIIVASNGSCCVMGSQVTVIKKGTRFFENDGCASMGYGLPAAIGACIANGKKEVFCYEGDGSLQMNIQELQTIITYDLPIKILYINNEGYHSIRQTQRNFFNRFVGIGLQSKDLSFPDMQKICYAYGIDYIKAKKLSELDDVFEKFINEEGAMFCEVMCDKDVNFAPKLSAKKLDDGTMVSPDLSDMFPFLDRQEYDERIKTALEIE